jgi:hypothetical protein
VDIAYNMNAPTYKSAVFAMPAPFVPAARYRRTACHNCALYSGGNLLYSLGYGEREIATPGIEQSDIGSPATAEIINLYRLN